MELEMRKNENGVLKFLLSDVTPAFANSIRRTILKGIPVMAINEVEFSQNDSVISDEILAHRLGQLALNTPDGFLLPSECDCREGRCSNCSVTFSLSAEGPCEIRAEDLESTDPEVSPVQEESPVVKLTEGQKLEFDAIARLGLAEEHANWQPAIASYKYMPVIDIDQDARDDWEDCVDACPEDVFEEDGDELKMVDLESCTMCEACVDECPDAISVEGDSSKYIFRVESTGAFSPEKAVKKALEKLQEKTEEFTDKLDRF